MLHHRYWREQVIRSLAKRRDGPDRYDPRVSLTSGESFAGFRNSSFVVKSAESTFSASRRGRRGVLDEEDLTHTASTKRSEGARQAWMYSANIAALN